MTKDYSQWAGESGLLDNGLKEKVDNATEENLQQVKQAIVDEIKNNKKFGTAKKVKHMNQITSLRNVKDLQFFYYNYILAFSGLKSVNSSLNGDSIRRIK